MKTGWNLQPPGQNEPLAKTVRGRTYKWCNFCNYWGLHNPVTGRKCKKIENKNEKRTTNEDSDNPEARLSFCFDDIGSGFLAHHDLTYSILNEVGSNSVHLPYEWKSSNDVLSATRALMADGDGHFDTTNGHKDSILIDSCATLHITSDLNDLHDFSEANRNVVLKG
eukprot:IDg1352t1